MNLVSIVIPVYKTLPDYHEIQSLTQCLKVLEFYQITIVCPRSLNISEYKLISDSLCKEITIERFEDNYFDDIAGYNQLMVSIDFYKRFMDFDYILIYQLDSWIFLDELKYWCFQGYDYIGAPWFEGWDKTKSTSSFSGVGNGGFSLRNIHSSLKILNSFKRIEPLNKFWDFNKFNKLNLKGKAKYAINFIKTFAYLNNNTYYLFNDYRLNEDIFWSTKAKKLFSWYNVPSEDIAMKFSFEVNPSHLFKINNCNLPTGCHAYNTYEPEFWKSFIHNL
jgi:hypothetical protein